MGGWDGTEAPSIPKESHQHLQWGEGLIERGRGRRFPMPSIDGADRGGRVSNQGTCSRVQCQLIDSLESDQRWMIESEGGREGEGGGGGESPVDDRPVIGWRRRPSSPVNFAVGVGRQRPELRAIGNRRKRQSKVMNRFDGMN